MSENRLGTFPGFGAPQRGYPANPYEVIEECQSEFSLMKIDGKCGEPDLYYIPADYTSMLSIPRYKKVDDTHFRFLPLRCSGYRKSDTPQQEIRFTREGGANILEYVYEHLLETGEMEYYADQLIPEIPVVVENGEETLQSIPGLVQGNMVTLRLDLWYPEAGITE